MSDHIDEAARREAMAPEDGFVYDFWDPEVVANKISAVERYERLNAIPLIETEARDAAIRDLFGSAGANPVVMPVFNCDNGRNIHVGDEFLANYNVTILDIAPVTMGDHVMLAPNVCIATVNHPISPADRRKHFGIARPVTIGDDVWVGSNVTIMPGVTIGSNVIVAAGAVVTHDVPDNVLVGGVPAKVIKQIEDDVERD